MSQRWPLSQKANKDHGTCAHCFKDCQLHLKDSTVHLHGPRDARCPGSNKPPLNASAPTGCSPLFSSQPLPLTSFAVQQAGRCMATTTTATSPLTLPARSNSANSSSFNNTSSATLTTTVTTRAHVIVTSQQNNGSQQSNITNNTPTSQAGQHYSQTNNQQQPSTASTQKLTHSTVSGPLLKHIPKPARPACCNMLTNILTGITSKSQDPASWEKLFSFAPNILLNPPKAGGRCSLSETIKTRIAGTSGSSGRVPKPAARGNRKFDLASAVSSRIEDGNIKAALRLLCSDDKPADATDTVLAAMQARHPPAPTDRATVPDPSSFSSLQVTESEVLKAIKSFPAGSSGGPDGFKPQHLLELVTCQSNGPALLTAITGFINLVLDGGCPASVCPVFFGARLIALEKKSGGYRHIAVGYTFRRLAAKCANKQAQKKLAD